MATWFFEPGHTAAMFRARHMMVTYVRGHFKNVSGSLVFDPENPAQSSADVTIDAGTIWTGQPQRDAHLRSADFLDVENHPRITFKAIRSKSQARARRKPDPASIHWGFIAENNKAVDAFYKAAIAAGAKDNISACSSGILSRLLRCGRV